MTVGSLFAGIGGFDLGLERAGFTIQWQVEIDPFASLVLEKHWPHVSRHRDIRASGAHNLSTVDLVCGGFPCQPFSSASRGRRVGEHLWPEMRRVIDELRPAWVLAENVPQIDGPALDQVVADLVASDYDVGLLEIPACAVGLDHRRARYWICGHTDRHRQPGGSVHAEVARLPGPADDARRMGAAHGLPGRLDRHRMRALGNAIVPQIAEWLGRCILDREVAA